MPPKAKAKAGAAKARGTTPTTSTARGKAKAKGKSVARVQAAPPSPQNRAATSLQAAARGFLGRRHFAHLRSEQKRHEAEMADAIREADAAAARAERRRQEAVRKKEDEKREKASQLAADTKALLEGAFDGDLPCVRKLLDKGLPVDAADANGTTALSEAACGGMLEVVRLLLQRKGDPNSLGEFKRTPLWRATYAGHIDSVQLLLEAGSDPRLLDEQGQVPADLTPKDEILERLRTWDTAQTDDLVDEYQAWIGERRLEEDFRQKEAMRSVDAALEAAKVAHAAAQMMLAKAKSQFRDREKQYGVGLACGHDEARLACASADAEVQRAEVEAKTAQDNFDKASLAHMAAAEVCGANAKLPGREVPVLSLNNVLLRDLGDRIAKDSQWPLVIDPDDLGKKLLYYSGCAVLSFFRADEMEPERLRVALLTMIRAGGVLAVDLFSLGSGVDLALLGEPFDRIRAGLFDDLCSRTLLSAVKGTRRHVFQELITKEEKVGQFKLEVFSEVNIAKFKFMVLTATAFPHKELLDAFDVLRVIPAGG